jgi:hypothetical protein
MPTTTTSWAFTACHHFLHDGLLVGRHLVADGGVDVGFVEDRAGHGVRSWRVNDALPVLRAANEKKWFPGCVRGRGSGRQRDLVIHAEQVIA